MKTIIDIHTHGRPFKEFAINNIIPDEHDADCNCLFSVGIHPWKVKETNNASIALLKEKAAEDNVIAIGETGIDKLYPESMNQQEEIFELHAIIAEQVKKPLIIHNVKAMEQIIAQKKRLSPTVPWIIHGFRGKRQQTIQLLGQGFILSIGEYFNEEALKIIPTSALMVESDESNMPIETIYRRIAEARNVKIEELENAIKENIRKVFKI